MSGRGATGPAAGEEGASTVSLDLDFRPSKVRRGVTV